ncbi:MAG: IS630 family transposase [Chloroflexi bacterium]|nr:IS630 family transposase [Chloroflexota bacterium]MBU1659855.1 IS630 family transposase [Chloroflexota bacterium]
MARPVYKYRIRLSGGEVRELRQAKKKGRKDARLVIRILIILLAGKGKTIVQIAEVLSCCEQTVLNQRKRFLERRSEGPVAALQDLPRSGRPVVYGAQERAQVIVTTCETLRTHELPLSRFSTADLLRIMQREEGLESLSQATLARILAEDALKPWQYRYWLFPRDPDFVRKACIILDLYTGFWEGQRLGPDEYILSADEKSIQILKRCHPGLTAIPGYEARIEFEYERLGTIAYHAAWDVFRGRIFGRVAPNTCIATFNQLVDLVMAQTPYHSSARTFWIVDGGCAHHPSTFPERLLGMYPNAVAVPLPTHSSWLNQIEIFFSIVHRKVLTPLDVANEETLTKRLLDFQDYYQETAKPFRWKFTATDLKNRLDALCSFSLT